MLERLFCSRVRLRLLELVLLHPDEAFYARELSARLGAHYNAVWKELNNLHAAGILESENVGRIRQYRLNPNCPILVELRSILLKTTALGDPLRQALLKSPGVEAAFVYGSAATREFDASSDIDLLVIGTVDLVQLAGVIARLERAQGRAINYLLFDAGEWRDKLRRRDPFVENVLAAPKLLLIGTEDAIRGLGPTKAHQGVSSDAGGNSSAAPTRGARPRQRRTQSRSGTA